MGTYFDMLNQQVHGSKLLMVKVIHADHVVIGNRRMVTALVRNNSQCSIPVNPVQGQMLLFKTPKTGYQPK